VPASLPSTIAAHRRGAWAGRLDDLALGGGLSGWACAIPPEAAVAPLQVRLVIEDLLRPGCSWPLAVVSAALQRDDLERDGLALTCGFNLPGPLPLELPPRGTGTVLRAFLDTPEGVVELSGSPQRLNPERYRQLERLQRRGASGHSGGLHDLEGPLVHGWGTPLTTLNLLLDGQPCLELGSDTQGRICGVLPAAACDGRPHQLELRDVQGHSLDQRISFTPFQITPWPALLAQSCPPFPDHLHPLAMEQHRSLTTWLQWADAGLIPLPHNLPRLHGLLTHDPGGNAAAEPLDRPLQLPHSDQPQVSVVIPAHNHYGITRRCLLAIAYAPTRVAMELIVVDDGSSDGTSAALNRDLRGVRVLRHDQAQGFNQACHSGVALARAPVVVLLNNDTEPCACWLEELLEPFALWPDTGIVGAQLLFANGRLQEAGGIVWGDGQPWNYGRGGNPYDPRVSYTRQVDYVSGACLAIRRELWQSLGGFSAEFAPAYFEDTDLAFQVRAHQLTVRYAPLARVIHHEGTTCGIDPGNAEGSKRLQLEHAPLFRRKWQHAFIPSPPPSRAAAEQQKDRGIIGRVLVLDHGPPRPDRDAGSQAALTEMGLLQELGWKVTFLPANLAWLGRYSEALQRQGIETIHAPFVLSVEQFLQQRGNEFELIYLIRYTTVRDHIGSIRQHAPRARLMFCMADLHYLRELRQLRAAGLSGSERERAEAGVAATRRDELAAISAVDLSLSYSAVERRLIEAETFGRAATAHCPWVVECVEQPPSPQGRQGLAFLGSYTHPPNGDAITYLLAEIWPQLRQQEPGLELHLYGSGLAPELAQAWGREPGVRVRGWVAETASVYDSHRLLIAPLRAGAGLKGKVVGALARGTPQVLSPIAAEGTELRHGDEVLIASSVDDWLVQIARLLHDDELWRHISAKALAHARLHYSRQRGLQLMGQALKRLGLPVRGISQ
jgi:GT2 family glycosyltransferase